MSLVNGKQKLFRWHDVPEVSSYQLEDFMAPSSELITKADVQQSLNVKAGAIYPFKMNKTNA